MCTVFRDTVDNVTYCNAALSALGLLDVATDADRDVLRYLCAALSIRAAEIVSACKWGGGWRVSGEEGWD